MLTRSTRNDFPPFRSASLWLASLVVASLLLAACSSPAPAQPTAAPTIAPTAAPTAAAAAQTTLTGAPVPLVIYAANDYSKPVADAFSQKSGIPTQFVQDSTGPLLAKIQAEKNNPQWTVLWIDGAEALAGLDAEGMLLQGYEPNVQWTDQGKAVQPKSQAYIPTGLTVAGALVYDTRTVSKPPATWQDLLMPEWKDQVGMNNPSISGPTYPFVAGMMDLVGGEEAGKTFFQQLKANGLKVYNKNPNTLHALDIGEIKLAVVQSSAGVGAIQTTPTIKVAFPSKVSLMPSAIGIDAGASAQAQAEAKMLVEFLLSPAGQQIATTAAPKGDSLFWPIVAGASPAADVPALASVPGQIVDPYTWGPKQADIDQWFTDTIVP